MYKSFSELVGIPSVQKKTKQQATKATKVHFKKSAPVMMMSGGSPSKDKPPEKG